MTTIDLVDTEERRIMDLRKLDLPGAKVLGRYNYTSPHHPLPPHRHPGMIEICYLHRGRQTYQVGEDTFMLRGGEFFVTFSGEWHSTGPDPEARGVLYWLILELSPLPDAFLGQAGKTGGSWPGNLADWSADISPRPCRPKIVSNSFSNSVMSVVAAWIHSPPEQSCWNSSFP